MESPSVDDDGDCFSPMLLNATSVNIEVYYNKAVNYTLMVTFVSYKSCYFIDIIFSVNCIFVDSLTYENPRYLFFKCSFSFGKWNIATPNQ